MESGFERVRELLDEAADEDEQEIEEQDEPSDEFVAAVPDVSASTEPAVPVDPAEAPAPEPERKKRIRARTISIRRMTKEELRIGRLLYPETEYDKPRARAECANGERPCPFVSCQHHLYLDVNPETGSIKLNFPHLEVWEMTETCALDVADRGGTTLEDVGEILNLTRERIRQVEMRGLSKLGQAEALLRLKDLMEDE